MIQRKRNEGKMKERELFAARKCREFFSKFPKFAIFEVQKNTLPRMSTDGLGHARPQDSSHSSFYGEVKSFSYEDLPCCVWINFPLILSIIAEF